MQIGHFHSNVNNYIAIHNKDNKQTRTTNYRFSEKYKIYGYCIWLKVIIYNTNH
jgi:hypothetical protein